MNTTPPTPTALNGHLSAHAAVLRAATMDTEEATHA